jgi:redox-sensitive bicupin YhaK (pirin superfamily)
VKTVVHRAPTRGHFDHGWLKTWHTFSFAGYYDSNRVHFGLLRVLNDDIIEPGVGFGLHPHDNMEIVTIPLSGAVAHRDSMGSVSVIRPGEVQIMSAGSGLQHSEYNHSEEEALKLLQVWVFPKVKNIPPRYDQKSFAHPDQNGVLIPVVSPEKSGDTLWINQDAWFFLGNLQSGKTVEYSLHHNSHGVYLFVMDGKIVIGGETLGTRDGMGISEKNFVTIKSLEKTAFLLIEVPMR